jgi:hypothetical protein
LDRAHAAATECGKLLQLDAPLFTTNRARLVELAARNRVPTIYRLREYAEAGGLISYGVDRREHYRCAAVVDKILKGARPADLSVELPIKFELVINLRTAKALDISLRPALLWSSNACPVWLRRRYPADLVGSTCDVHAGQRVACSGIMVKQ